MSKAFTFSRFAWLLGLAASLAIVMAVAACGGDDDDGEEVDGGAVGADVPPAREIVIVASDQLSFSPETIRVNVGEPVRVVLDNSEAKALHDFKIEHLHASDVHAEGGTEHMEHDDMHEDEEEAIHIAAEGGETASIEFTPEEAGEYAFFCSVEGHREGGMEGTIIVE